MLKDSVIFTPAGRHNSFHKLDTGDRRTTKNVGLGLCVVKDILVLHGRQIQAESTLGEGSVLSCCLCRSRETIA